MKVKKLLEKIFTKKNKKKCLPEKTFREVWLITGCSSGIGKELCIELLKRGYKVAAGLRNKERLSELKQKFGDNILLLEMDVTSEEQIKNAVNNAISYFGKIDVLVNNAGISHFGAIEETSISDAKNIIETNFWGYVRTAKNMLSHMRQQKSGLIINISSICGVEAYPGVGYYSSSKFAIEGFSEALRKEVAAIGINVLTVILSTARTNLSINFDLKKPEIEEYQKVLETGYNTLLNKLEYKESKISPEKVAKAIIDEAEYLTHSNLYLGSDCINISKNKYTTLLKDIETQSETASLVEYKDGE